MRNFTVIHLLLFLLLMLVYQCSKAQDMVVTIKGDTLKGKVKPLIFGADKKVQVTDANKKKNVLTLFQVRHFVMEGEKFVPVKTTDGYYFMKVIKEGYLSLLAYQAEKQAGYDTYYFQRKDGTGISIPNLGFRKQISKFLEDVPSVAGKVESGELGKQELTLILDEYNAALGQKTTVSPEALAQRSETARKLSSWETLESKVKVKEFESKADALDMIAEIRNKISRGERVPKFLIDGLKGALADADLSTELDAALATINP